jgi:formylglycine-generating enzyme required for sulfatase activity
VYTIDDTGVVTGIDRATAQSTYGTVYFLPTEHEWYKAAYYDPYKTGGAGYWNYPTRDDAQPDGIDSDGDTEFDAVFQDGYDQGQPNDVDNAGVLSAYGTMGQGGNVREWSHDIVRGGYWGGGHAELREYYRFGIGPTAEYDYIGFRVASSEVVPEPGSLAMLTGLTLMGLFCWRRRKAA